MLTRNGMAIMKLIASYDRKVTTVKKIDGNDGILYSNSNSYGVFLTNLKLYVGSGTTAETIDDYCLESQINTLDMISSTGTNSNNPSYIDGYINTFTSTFKNSTNDDIIVNEIGIIGKEITYGVEALIYREVLETPITIAPNTTKAFSVTIS